MILRSIVFFFFLKFNFFICILSSNYKAARYFLWEKIIFKSNGKFENDIRWFGNVLYRNKMKGSTKTRISMENLIYSWIYQFLVVSDNHYDLFIIDLIRSHSSIFLLTINNWQHGHTDISSCRFNVSGNLFIFIQIYLTLSR